LKEVKPTDIDKIRKEHFELWDKINPAYDIAYGRLYSPPSVDGQVEASTESKEKNNPMANQPRASSSPIPENGLVNDEWFENFPQNSDGFWKTAEKSETESPENEADKDKPENPAQELAQESQEMSQQSDADQYYGMTEQEYNEAMQEASLHFSQSELEQQGVTAPETQQEISPEMREELSNEIMTEYTNDYANDNQPQPEPEIDVER